FPDYSPSELLTIFEVQAADGGYELEPGARERAAAVLRAAWERRDERFGNGRLARNLFEKALAAHANRVADSLHTDVDQGRVLSLLVAEAIPSEGARDAICPPGGRHRDRRRGPFRRRMTTAQPQPRPA